MPFRDKDESISLTTYIARQGHKVALLPCLSTCNDLFEEVLQCMTSPTQKSWLNKVEKMELSLIFMPIQ